MPERETIKRARRDARAGKSTTTQAGEFVREEMHHIRKGKHGARSTKQAIAIGLSKARSSGVKLPPPKRGRASPETRASARRSYAKGQSHSRGKVSPRRSRATARALRREGHRAASRERLPRQARTAAQRRSRAERRAAARKAARTKRSTKRRAAARPHGRRNTRERSAA
jgi:hypothetical protein